ncbi:hypothetical protein LCGC14_1079460 [marine sediment metagenome]|uniref:Lipopolysaccharide core heptose(I) kinase n=1 Tax=marine sediment metagenome TaxID=412755 RepID=A0A0F9MFU0_9ZZZZ
MIKQTLYLRKELSQAWQSESVFAYLSQMPGEIFRDKEGRRTLRFELNKQHYFLKYHQGVGWAEIVKNLLSFRLPIISARSEWQAVKFLTSHQLDTMTLAGYGEKGLNPAKLHSFVITDDLSDTMSLEELGRQWTHRPPSFRSKQNLIEKLAHIAGTMHREGMNHRDFYLCHFLLDKSFAETNDYQPTMPIYLIDLHRAQIRKRVPKRWQVKDLGSLYFSAYAVPLTQRDLFRFIKTYTGMSLRQALSEHKDLWQQVKQRADTLYAE